MANQPGDDTADPLDRFLQRSAAAFRGRDSALARRIAAAVEALPARRWDWTPCGAPAAAHFERVRTLGTDATAPLVEAAAGLEDRFRWLWRTRDGFGDRRRGDQAHVAFVGPAGLVRSDALLLGIFLIGPRAFYPDHSHAADEVYYVIAGRGEWRKGDGPFAGHGPGGLIEMPSFEPHAIRTGAEPVLMVYAWTGDIAGEYRVL